MSEDFTTMKPSRVMLYSLVGYERDGTYIAGASTIGAAQMIEDAKGLSLSAGLMDEVSKAFTGKPTDAAAATDPKGHMIPGAFYTAWQIINKLKYFTDQIHDGKDKETNQALMSEWQAGEGLFEQKKQIMLGPLQSLNKSQDSAVKQGAEVKQSFTSMVSSLANLDNNAGLYQRG